MEKNHPQKRSYNSFRRQESARLTRKAIARAALQIFSERGYAGATIDAIAEAASVAPETIYASFGSKREVLHYAFDIAIGGDEEPVAIIDRPGPQAMLHETDPHRMVKTLTEGLYAVSERAAPVFAILAEAAKTEPELASLLSRVRSERLTNMGIIARAMGNLTPLRVSESQAAETLWTLTSPELFSLVTGPLKWRREQYVAWLQDSLERLLFQAGR